jgi:hypothetical protein
MGLHDSAGMFALLLFAIVVVLLLVILVGLAISDPDGPVHFVANVFRWLVDGGF